MKKSLLPTIAMSAVAIMVAASFTAFAGDKDKQEKRSEKTEKVEPMAKIGSAAPEFKLMDTEGKPVSLSQFKGKVVVIEWYNSGCPFVKRHHEKYKTMADTAKKFGDKVVWLAINSGAPGKEGHGKDVESKKAWNITWPILNDETGAVGRLYGAKTTPHMFVVDQQGILRYNGAIDNDRGDEKSPTEKVNYVTQAVEELLAGKTVTTPETKPYGCSVKYGT